MLVETPAFAMPADPNCVPDPFATMDQSNEPYDAHRLLADGRESLATSSDAASLQRSLLELTRDLYFLRPTAWSPVSSLKQLFPILVDVSGFSEEEAQVTALAPDERTRLLYTLRAVFEAEPLEDGIDHPAEDVIREALHSTEDQCVLEWLRTFSLDEAHPNLAASVFRCLGRQARPGTDSWRTVLVRSALKMDDPEIRDAAVQAAESWGGQNIRNELILHYEPLPWLRSYVRDVIEDLGK